MGVFAWILVHLFDAVLKDDPQQELHGFLIAIFLGMIGLTVVVLRDTIVRKLVIDKEKIFIRGTFSNGLLLFNEIKGYRITDKDILVEPDVDGKKSIKISKYFSRREEIIEWLESNYRNLDLLEAEEDKQEILDNNSFGLTTEQREEKLKTARRTAKIVNWAGGIVGVWVLFWPNPYEYAVVAAIAFPIICIIALRIFKGLIRVNEKPKSVYPSIFMGFLTSGMGLCIRSMQDFNIFDYSNIWMPAIVVTAVIVALLFTGTQELNPKRAKDYLLVLTISFVVFGYAYGAVTALNCIYDNSADQVFNAKILNKRISTGKSTKRYFQLAPWGQQKEIAEVHVSQDLYEQLNENDTVKIYFKKGKFKIPWFALGE